MARRIFISLAIAYLILLGIGSFFWWGFLWSLVVFGPLIFLGIFDMIQRKHTLLRIYPIIGHGRYLMEAIRPEIQQYFVESNIDGTPINREMRSIIYRRSKGDLDTLPFGTQRDVYREGYEWMIHSLNPKEPLRVEPRIRIGAAQCKNPYDSSHLNISAMSFGSLSKNAILALNKGAQIGGFCHNTGEGGLSPYHLKFGGDLVWQIGTGYFGCRRPNGQFDSEQFKEKAQGKSVRMIEVKLSQGAKPAHGGLLPASKVSLEIAQIRGVPVGKEVLSPPAHSTFSSPKGLLEFLAQLREWSGDKPIGFKLCLGDPKEFLGICKAILATEVYPDFITVDGCEGGTGAAPLEFSNSVGMPLREGLTFVHSALLGIGYREKIKIIAAGKIVTAFQMFKTMAMGADICNSARGMMMALGCIQARRCHSNTCPTGVATQDPQRNNALDVADKAKRVARLHHETIKTFLELVGAGGLSSPDEIRPEHVRRRVDSLTIKHYGEIYPFSRPGGFLQGSLPEPFQADWDQASAEHF